MDFLEFVRFANPAIAIIENVPDYLNSTSMLVIRKRTPNSPCATQAGAH